MKKVFIFYTAMSIIFGSAEVYSDNQTGINDVTYSNISVHQVDVRNKEDIPVTDGFVFPIGNPDSLSWNISLDFGEGFNGNYGHLGQDYSIAGAKGKPVYNTSKGKVSKINKSNSGWGWAILIAHKLPDDKIIYSLYAHLLENSILVEEGQEVYKRMEIGKVGNTGFATGYHLHFGIKDRDGFGKGYTGKNFTGTSTLYNETTYYNPSWFIGNYSLCDEVYDGKKGPLSAGSYLVTCDVEVPQGETLTIHPGAKIYFNSGCKIIANGTLNANGEIDNPIYLISKDDKHGTKLNCKLRLQNGGEFKP